MNNRMSAGHFPLQQTCPHPGAGMQPPRRSKHFAFGPRLGSPYA